MKHLEKERSYIFRLTDIYKLTSYFPDYSSKNIKTDTIEDYYLNKNLRLRKENDLLIIQNKTDGNKIDGRQETYSFINQQIFDLLKLHSKLKIIKKRQQLLIDNDFVVTLDIFDCPAKILILEIESLNGNIPPQLEDVIKSKSFVECPLSAWNYFKRKIAICGAPSSGKTLTAKYISNILNIDFGINSLNTTEYATSFIQKYKRNPTFNDQFMIWHSQSKRENDAQKTSDLVISDCPTFLSYIYGCLLSENIKIENKNILLSKLYKRCLEDLYDYEQIFFLNLVNYEENNIRYNGKQESEKIQHFIIKFLEQHGIQFGNYTYNDKSDVLKDILYLNEI